MNLNGINSLNPPSIFQGLPPNARRSFPFCGDSKIPPQRNRKLFEEGFLSHVHISLYSEDARHFSCPRVSAPSKHIKLFRPQEGPVNFLQMFAVSMDQGPFADSTETFNFNQEGKCTVPGCTAIPGQCVEWKEQAPLPSPDSKNQFNIWSPDRGRIRY